MLRRRTAAWYMLGAPHVLCMCVYVCVCVGAAGEERRSEVKETAGE